MKTFCVVIVDRFNGYPLAVIAKGRTQLDATRIAVETEERGGYRCRVCEE